MVYLFPSLSGNKFMLFRFPLTNFIFNLDNDYGGGDGDDNDDEIGVDVIIVRNLRKDGRRQESCMSLVM